MKETEVVKAQLARVSMELSPFFANYGLTENAIAAGIIMISSGLPIVPVFVALSLTRHYVIGKLKQKYPQASLI
ncbi:MAG TPA: hypothetical protein VKC54_04910 [Patescibacteria group bacterium]|nr:hypothetical protein [Patescibacteria group bacterium]